MPRSPRGRPRDPAIDAAILGAARRLLVRVGYTGLAMEAVAAAAGVSKPTLYLRYPTKAALVLDAVFGKTKTRAMPAHEDLVADLREAYSWAVDEFSAPEARAALPGLLAEMAAVPELARRVGMRVVDSEYARVRDMLEQARDRGEIRADADLMVAIDAFVGTALARVSLFDRPVDQDFGARLVDLLVHGLAPR